MASLNRSRRIGIEIEMAVPLIGGGQAHDLRVKMADILSANGLKAIARTYSHSPVPEGYDLVVEYDGSIRGETVYQGIEWVQVEVKTRILTGIADFDRIVSKLCDICRYLGARQNTSTAVHLHIECVEVRDVPAVIRSFYNLAHRFQNPIFGLVAPSRRDNRYCKGFASPPKLLHECKRLADFGSHLDLAGMDRYCAFNMTHLFGAGPRIEFRHHHGSLDFEKLKHWRNLCLRLIDHSIQRTCKASPVQLPNDKASLLRMLVTLGLKPNTRVFAKVEPELRATGRFLLRRWNRLNKSSGGSEGEGQNDPAPGTQIDNQIVRDGGAPLLPLPRPGGD